MLQQRLVGISNFPRYRKQKADALRDRQNQRRLRFDVRIRLPTHRSSGAGTGPTSDIIYKARVYRKCPRTASRRHNREAPAQGE